MIGKTIEQLQVGQTARFGKTECINQDGTRIIDGEALVSPPKH